MRARLPALFVLVCAVPQLTWAATYKVTNTDSSGYKSLRWAIQKANSHLGPDRIIFDASLSGQTIRPTSRLDLLTDNATTVDGDLDNDGAPDITLDGELQPWGDGLRVSGEGCVVEGLSIVRFKHAGLALLDAVNCRVRNCHLGVALDGQTPLRNGYTDLHVLSGNSHQIGAPGAGNLFAGGSTQGRFTLLIEDAEDCAIESNYFGMNRAGTAALGAKGSGLKLLRSSGQCGGHVVRGNVFADLYRGVDMSASTGNTVQGNLFGLAADGATALPIRDTGVFLFCDSANNRIGGLTPAARNVFVGKGAPSTGVGLWGTGCDRNWVQGNYFGMNAAGTARASLAYCISIGASAGAQIIGGNTKAAGNYLTPKGSVTYGVLLMSGGSGTLIRNNTFGLLPAGGAATHGGMNIMLHAASATIRDNVIARAFYGVYVGFGAGMASAGIFGNSFRNCTRAVEVYEPTTTVNLGNLQNLSAKDDGGNDFQPSNDWYVYNETPNRIRAEGNEFHTTVRRDIDLKIHDKLDDGACGRVDFIPLAGGVVPTGDTGLAALTVTGAAALPTAAGAEVVFSLSAPADVTVTVLNLAGRPIATLASDRPAEAGLQRLTWSGRTVTGTPAPAGVYVVRVAARGADGAEANAIAALRLSR